jgi:hypothetical protein
MKNKIIFVIKLFLFIVIVYKLYEWGYQYADGRI